REHVGIEDTVAGGDHRERDGQGERDQNDEDCAFEVFHDGTSGSTFTPPAGGVDGYVAMLKWIPRRTRWFDALLPVAAYPFRAQPAQRICQHRLVRWLVVPARDA